MDDYQIVKYAGATPGADSAIYNLFDSTVYRSQARSVLRFADFMRYVLALKNSGTGTLKAFASMDGGTTWVEFYELAVPASTVQRMNQITIPLEPHLDVKVDWVNGGAAQSTWYVGQALDDGQAPVRTIFLDAAGDTDPADTQNVTTVQLPSSLGPKVKTASLSITPASDQLGQAAKAASFPVVLPSDQLGTQIKSASLSITPATDQLGQTTKAASFPVVLPSDQLGQQTSALSLSTVFANDSIERNAAALRGPLRNEILVFALTGASVAYNVPDASIGSQPNWKGKYIEAYADGCDVYLQFDTGTAASVDEAVLSTTSTVSGRTSVAPAGNEAWIIPRGQWIPIPVPSNAQTFALKGSVSTGCKLRTKLAQS
jgi:hypothetical protein